MGGVTEPQELDDYFHNLDMEDKYTKRPTVWELAQAFPDCRDVAVRVILELKDSCKMTEDVVANEFIKATERYKRYDHTKRFLQMTRSTNNSARLNIDSAKAVKIQSIYDFGNVKKTAKRVYAKCPFHEEKNPSFIIYTDSNSWHCFSCGRGGSVIDFIMYLYAKPFISAVKYLNGE